MALGYFDFSPLKTRLGLLCICFNVISLLEVTLIVLGVDKSSWATYKITCSDPSCPTSWLVELGFTFVIFIWFYSLTVVAAMTLPKIYKNSKFLTMIKHGYSTSAALFFCSFVLMLMFAAQIWTFKPCEDYCYYSKEYKSGIFQPAIFCACAVIALLAGILAIYIHEQWKPKKSVLLKFKLTPLTILRTASYLPKHPQFVPKPN